MKSAESGAPWGDWFAGLDGGFVGYDEAFSEADGRFVGRDERRIGHDGQFAGRDELAGGADEWFVGRDERFAGRDGRSVGADETFVRTVFWPKSDRGRVVATLPFGPVLKLEQTGAGVMVRRNWRGQNAFLDLLQIEVHRGSGFHLLAYDSTPDYLETPPITVAAKWTYRAIARVGDARVGQWSGPVSINVAP
jgi:hypothetical protein